MKYEDRPLMDAAANAAGIPLRWPMGEVDLSPRRTDTWVVWNPLDDSADALELAADLHMSLEPVRTVQGGIDPDGVIVKAYGHVTKAVMYGEDRAAAWRRAIVETAAALDADK